MSSLPSLIASTTDTEHITRTETLAPGGTLRLKNFSGRVIITGERSHRRGIDAVRRGTRDRLDRSSSTFALTGSTLVIEANQSDYSWLGWSRRNRIVETDFDIKVPRKTNLDIDVFSSPVTVDRRRGVAQAPRLFVATAAPGRHGPCASPHIQRIGGDPGENVAAENQSIDVDTFSGNVQLHVPDNARGTVTFNSFSGHLNSDMPLTLHSTSRRSLKAELGGGGGGNLRFKTFSGSVRIDR